MAEDTPPVETPPVETPPVETPPVETPPVETPPVEPGTLATDKAAADKAAADKVVADKAAADKVVADKLAKAGAPEAYEDFTVPEGIEADADLLGKFSEVARELNLTQEHAQKVVDLQAQYMKDAADASQKSWETTQEEWVKAASDDKEIGGEKFKENLAVAKTAIDTFGTPELKQMLDNTGTGNHVEFLRFFHRVGLAIGDDKLHLGHQNSADPQDRADILFGKPKQ